MGVRFMLQEDKLVAMLSGEIDHHTAAGLREDIDRKTEQVKPKMLALDFSKVGFMDSSGIGLVMGRYRLMESLGGQLCIWNLSQQMERIVSLSGVNKLVTIETVKTEPQTEETQDPPAVENAQEKSEEQPEKPEGKRPHGKRRHKKTRGEHDPSRDIFSDSSKEVEYHEQ